MKVKSISLKWVSFVMLLFPLIAFAQHDHAHPHDEGTADENVTPGEFVVYAETPKYELTLKHKRIDTGKNASLLLYVADYATNRPIDNAEIKITVNGAPGIQLETEPHEPGIYHIDGIFPEQKSYALNVSILEDSLGADLMQISPVVIGQDPPSPDTETAHTDLQHGMSWWILALVFIGGIGAGYLFFRKKPRVAAAVLLIVCMHAMLQNVSAHGDHPEEEDAQGGTEVLIPKETQFLFGMLTRPVSMGGFHPSVELFGTVVPSPEGFAIVTSPQSGKIMTLKVAPGQLVRAGQTVATVQPSASISERVEAASESARLRADLQAARQEVIAAEKELKRLRSIADIAARKDVEAAEARYNSARAILEGLQTATGDVNAAGTMTLIAPVSGTVGQFTLSAGTEVMAGTSLFTITNLEKVYVEAQVYDKDVDFVNNASNYTVTCTNQDHETAEVRIVSAAMEVNPSNQSQKVLFELINPDDEFKIGEFVTLHAFQQKSDRRLFVPNSALSQMNGNHVLFVKSHPELFTARFVSLGEDNGTHTVILQGLQEKERYITTGTYQVKMMMLNQ